MRVNLNVVDFRDSREHPVNDFEEEDEEGLADSQEESKKSVATLKGKKRIRGLNNRLPKIEAWCQQ